MGGEGEEYKCHSRGQALSPAGAPPMGGPWHNPGPLTLVQLGVGGQTSVLLLARLLCLVVIELVPAPAGLVREHNTWRIENGSAVRAGEGQQTKVRCGVEGMESRETPGRSYRVLRRGSPRAGQLRAADSPSRRKVSATLSSSMPLMSSQR